MKTVRKKNITLLKNELKRFGSTKKAQASARFFKTGEGQYGEGDVFIGVTMPEQRNIAKKFLHLSLEEIERLLHAKEHECRMTALIILVEQFKDGDRTERESIYRLYLRNTKWINNWDLVDVSAEYIVGLFLENRAEKMRTLIQLAKSKSLWERRISMLATFAYIKNGDAKEALLIAEILLNDTHDLIQKAVGWMLREVGKRCSIKQEEKFLRAYAARMPRTMLRYATEHFPEEKRSMYMGMARKREAIKQ